MFFSNKKKSEFTIAQDIMDATYAAIGNVSARVMIANTDLHIIYMNDEVINFLKTVEADIKKDLPNFEVSTLLGKNIDVFHKNPSHQRGMLELLNAPYKASIRVGGYIFNLRATPLFSPSKTRLGTVVEWEESTIMDNASQIAAINKAQAVIEFNLDGTIRHANENFLKTLGYRLDEVKGQHHNMFVEPSYKNSNEYREFWAKLNRGEFRAAQYMRIGKGGKEVWIEASYNPIFDVSGKPYKVVKFATDITKQIELIANVKKLVDTNVASIDAAVVTVAREATAASSASQQTSANVQAVASGAEELHASVVEIAQNMTRSRAEVDKAYQRADDANGLAGKLSSAANAMNGIVDLIRDITEKINLLSLNATIEAARAGESGKGFAVVASEVKILAGQAAQAADRISTEIDGMQSVSNEVVGSLTGIRQSIDVVRDYISGVAAAVEEQSAVARDMSSNMQIASTAVSETSTNVAAIVEAADVAANAVEGTKAAAATLG
ncbi:MAG: PAS domain-containing methyl-accepting chemotaxis protein [Pseudomonadota bacterium]